MPVAFGTTSVTAVYHGSTLIADLRHGTTQIPMATVPDAPTGVAVTVSELTVPDAPTGVGVTVYGGRDEFFSDVSLLLQDSLADESYNGHTLTYHGNAGLDADSKVGNYSYLFNGTSDKITTTADSSLELDADFTIEFWAKTTQSYGSGGRRFYCIRQSGTSAANALIFGTSNGGVNASLNYVGTTITSSGVTVNDGNWHHYAATRSGSNLELWIDGVSRATGTTSATPSQVGLVLAIGHDHLDQANKNFVGRIDGLRVTKNVARYTAQFTPTTQPFPATNGDDDFADVVLLMQDSFADESLLGSTVTNNGGTLDTSSPKVGTASLAFNGSSHVSIAHDANQAWGTGDFTIEYWLYADSPSTTDYKVLNKDGFIGRCFVNNFNSTYGAGALTFALPGVTASVITVGTVPDATWTYVTISRTNGTLYYGLNGSLQSQANYTHNFSSGNNPIEIAKQATYGGSQLVGKIDSLRITKAGRYQTNFTPPTTEFPN